MASGGRVFTSYVPRWDMNWKHEAMERLHNYSAMVEAVDNIPRELKRLEMDAVSLPASRTDKPRVNSTPAMGEDRLINNLVKRRELAASHENAKIWMEVTNRALSVLSREEKLILTRLYIRPAHHGASRPTEVSTSRTEVSTGASTST